MNKIAAILSFIGVLTVGALTVNAKVEGNTIESCSALLPAGYMFTMNLAGTIDTSSDKRELKANLSLSDGTKNENPEMQAAVKPFLNCVAPLIKKSVEPL